MSFDVHIGLIFACPFDEEVKNGPMKDFRFNNSIPERVFLWKMISTAAIAELITQHQVCVAYR